MVFRPSGEFDAEGFGMLKAEDRGGRIKRTGVDIITEKGATD